MINHLPTCLSTCTGNCLGQEMPVRSCCPHGNTCFGDCPQCSAVPVKPCCDQHAEHPGSYSPCAMRTNGAGIETRKLRMSPGRPRGARNLHAKHPSAISRAFLKAGLNWQTDFAEAIKANKTARIKLWLKLLPYLVTQRNHSTSVKRWKGKASKAAMIALQALEERKQ